MPYFRMFVLQKARNIMAPQSKPGFLVQSARTFPVPLTD